MADGDGGTLRTKAPFFLGLRGRLVAGILVVQAVLLAGLIYEHIRDIGEHLGDQAQLRAQQLTVLLNASLATYLIQADYAAAREVLEATRSQAGLAYLQLVGPRGNTIAQAGESPKLPSSVVPNVFDEKAGLFATAVPITMAGQKLATLYFGMPLDFLANAKRHAFWDSVMIGLAAMLISAALLSMLTVWITRRLGQLTRAADQVAAGNYDLDLPLGQQDEVGRAIIAFKQMAESIRAREEELRESRNHLLFLAERDSLTGLYNRHYFRHEMQRRLDEAARGGMEGALLLFDIDEFKLINDSFGHQAGDDILVAVANEIGRMIRRSETFCRLGGDEFVLIAHSATEAEVSTLAQRIVMTLGNMRFEMEGGQQVRLSCSMGVTLYPAHAADPETLLAYADAAMYQAKRAGKNSWQLYRPERDSAAAHLAMLTWKARIDAALEMGMFRLVYQGVYAMPGRRLSHVEALLRMYDEETGRLVTPNYFIPLAERSGQILDIDRWVIRESIRQLRLHPTMPPIAINVSGRTFDDPSITGYIAEQLREQGVAPTRLVVELTETSALSDLVDAERFVRQLRDLGCHICLDDFGAGFASFAYLKHIAADTIKIDGMFIRDLTHDEQSQVFVKAMIEVARGLGVTTIAECVEDEATLAMLVEFGVDYVQGYHLCRPREALPGMGASWEAGH